MSFIKQLLLSSAKGGLSMYWAIMIGVMIMAGYLVGDMIPERTPSLKPGEPLQVKEPEFSDSYAALQLRTFSFEGCQGAPAVLFLLDVSGSMSRIDSDGKSKLQQLQSALELFGDKMSDNGLIGVTTFSDHTSVELGMSLMQQSRSEYEALIPELQATGYTYMKDGMERVARQLRNIKSKHSDRDLILILVSDGIPESEEENRRCVLGGQNCTCSTILGISDRCFYKEQDPTRGDNVAKQIKDMGVKVYTIGIQLEEGSDARLKSEYNALLSRVASSPPGRYYIRANRAAELPGIFENISQTMCSDAS